MMKIKIILFLCYFLLTSCSLTDFWGGDRKSKSSVQQRADYVRQLRAAKEGKSKRAYATFLERELENRQGELNALEGMRRNEENFLSNDEQREREITRSSDDQTVFAIGKASRQHSLRDIEKRIQDVQDSIFDIRTLLSEL